MVSRLVVGGGTMVGVCVVVDPGRYVVPVCLSVILVVEAGRFLVPARAVDCCFVHE